MTGKERVAGIFSRREVDRIGVSESFWSDTRDKWIADGKIDPSESLDEHFGFDLAYRFASPLALVADLDAGLQVVEETDDTVLQRDGNGALLRRWKHKSGTPEHVDFLVKDRAGWDRHIRPRLTDPAVFRRRINDGGYREARDKCRAGETFFAVPQLNVFELMHRVCGHEYMLMGMALDPDWVKDMSDVFAELIVDLLETLFVEEGLPDAVFFFEDMGFKGKPFMSPAMYKDIVWPAHKRTFDFVRSKGLPVIVHSCGYVEPLLPGLIEAGMDCLQAMEVKAGMDLLKLKKKFGDRITLFGGMDIRTLETNDVNVVKAELDGKLPAAMAGGGYLLHTDHSVSTRVSYETYKFFLEYARQLGTY